MIDPLTASELAVHGVINCIKAAKLIKETIENVKHVKSDLIKLVSETERYQNVLNLLKIMTRELLQTPFRDMQLALDDRQILETTGRIHKAAIDIAETDRKVGRLFAGVSWGFKKAEAEKLVARLREEQTEIMGVVGIINATASLRSLRELEDVKAVLVKEPSPIDAFDGLTLAGSDHDPDHATWLGHINTEAHSSDYVTARNNLSDAAYYGKWEDVFRLLDHGRNTYHENWVNAIRLKPLEMCDKMSFWTLLHHAALWQAPKEVVQRLLSQGASRTLRTRNSEYSYSDQTPSEIASDIGYSELARVLAPVCRNTTPGTTLSRLEENFHSLIRRDFGGRVNSEHWYLPVLEYLTEFDGTPAWFEVRNHTSPQAGYWFRLDGRDLVVRSHGVLGADEVKEYRVTAQHYKEVEKATLLSK